MGIPLAIYGSHDSNICIIPCNDYFRIYEMERLLKKRYCSLLKEKKFGKHMIFLRDMIAAEYGITQYGSCFYAQLEQPQLKSLKHIFGFKHFEEIAHHYAHAAGALYQSPFEQCLIISSDSGGHELSEGIATFCIFYADRSKPMNQVIKKIASLPIDACGAYTLMAVPISEIKKTDVWTKYLSYAGKIMGLAAYGSIQQRWIAPIWNFYMGTINLKNLAFLGDKIGLNLSDINTIAGQPAYDLAATSQFVFEQVSMNACQPYITRYKLPVIMTGGGALNVLLNEKLRQGLRYPLFVPVNPNDCGLAFGMMALREPPSKTINIAYNGFGIIDIDNLDTYVQKYQAKLTSIEEIAQLLVSGNIIGVMRGNSECGPRALGNRSILCNPQIAAMKDTLNAKVKFREWYRPFAPVIKKDKVTEYFNFSGDCKFMSYAPTVTGKCTECPAIIHVDLTARLQTVTREDNEFLYDLLNNVESINGIPMLLNTSFNIKGNPILTTIADAVEVLETTELDYVLIEDYLFKKPAQCDIS